MIPYIRKTLSQFSRVNRTDPRTGLHGNDRFCTHRHVAHHAIALCNAARFQSVSELAYACVQIAVVDFCNLTVICFKYDGNLVRAACQLGIQTFVGNIEFALFEPFVKWGTAFIEHLSEWLFPLQGALASRAQKPL